MTSPCRDFENIPATSSRVCCGDNAAIFRVATRALITYGTQCIITVYIFADVLVCVYVTLVVYLNEYINYIKLLKLLKLHNRLSCL